MTEDELFQFRDRVLESLPGFVEPAAYAVGVVGPGGTRFGVINADRTHRLPAAVLGSVLGYRSGTCTIELTAATLDAAIARLAPAEACTKWDHPNLWTWRDVRATTTDDERVVAVFIGDEGDRAADGPQRELRRQAGWG